MAKYAEFGSTPLPTDQVTDEDLAASQPSEFTRGARAGTYGMGSSLRNAIGAAADAFDFDNFAAQQYGEADRLAQRAQETGPRIGSLDQLGREGYSLRNMGDYAAGVMGGAAPSIGLGLGASLATGGALVPSLLAGTAAFTPFEAGDAVAKWREANPGQQIDGQTALRLGATGVGSAAFQSMVPAAVGGKIMGRGLASAPATSLRQAVGRNLAEIPMEGFTEGAGEFIKQAGATPGAPTDWGQVGENALAGMIGGAPMAGLGAAGDYVHGNSQAIGGAVDKGVGAVKGLAGRAAAPMRDAADAAGPVMRDAWDGVADMARAAYDGTVEGFKASDLGKTLSERAATVRDWAKEIIDDPATPETVREGLRSAAASAGNKASQAYVWAAKQARDAQTAVQEKGVKNAAADALRKLREKTDDTVDRVMNDDFLGDAAAMAKATGDRVTELSQESGRRAAEYAAKWGNELLNRAGVNEETKAQVAEAMRNVGDRANQATIAAAKKAADATEGVRKRAKSFVDGVKKGMRDARRADVDVEAREIPDPAGLLEGPKKSEDYSGARQAVNDVLAKYRQELPEAVLTDPETASMVADGLQQFVRIAARPGAFDTIDKHWVRAQLGSLLGPRSTDILNDVWDAIGSSDPDAVARRYATLNDLKDMNDQAMSLTQVLISALPEGSPLAARQAEDAEVLMQWARGQLTKGMPEEQIKFEDRRMQEYIRDTYGEHAEAVMVALEQRANQSRDMQHQRAVSDDVEGEIDEFDGSVNIRDADAPDTSYVGGNKSGKVLVQDPAVHRANNTDGREGPTERLIKKLQNDNPGADVRFVSIVDKPELVDMIPSLKTKITKQKKALAEQYPGDVERQLAALEQFRDKMVADLKADGRGMVEVTQSGNPDALTQADLEAMRLDTERYGKADHPARLEVKDAEGKIEHIFDAVAVARVMRGKINRDRTWTVEDDRSDAHRLARAFSDGVAALMEKFGRFKVPPTTLIGRINGKNFTAGDIKGLEKDAGENFYFDDEGQEVRIRRRPTLEDMKSADELQAELDKAEMTIADMEAEDTDPRTLARLHKREADLIARLERAGMEENAKDTAEQLGQQNVDPGTDNIIKAGAALPARELQRPPQSGTANRKPPDAKPLIALAEKIRDSNAPAREKIADRLQTLALNIAMLSRKDQERLLDLKMARKVSEVSGTINDLARKYADRIVAPRGAENVRATSGRDTSPEAKPTGSVLTADARRAMRQRELEGVFDSPRTDVSYKRVGTDPFSGAAGGAPRPKAAAAKKAAFLKKAASGDAALIKELKASNDAKGLQRAVEALNAVELTDANEANIIAAVDVINARLTQLVQDPDVRYGMGTKKYSLRGLESRVDSQSDILRQTASASDETHALGQDVQELGAKLGALRASGVKKEEVFGKPVLSSLMAALAAKRLQGDNYALTLMRAVLNTVDQVYAQPLDAALEQRMNKQIDDAGAYGVRLGDLLDEYRSASLPLGTKVIARAVKKVAGDVAVSRVTGAVGADGFFEFSTGKIFVSETPSVGVASLVLHEGVHAATVAGVMKDKALQQALYDLLDHVVKENPRLASAYGAMNSFEFLAEGLSNVGLQDHLKQIKASDKVRKYLGETVATAWDAFVKLVRQAMGLSPAHESALSQLLDLSGRAMKATGQKGDVRVGQDDVDSTRKSGVVDPAETKTVVKEILAALGVKKSDPRNEAITKDAMGQLVQPNGKLSHADAISVRAAKLLLDEPQSEATGLTDSELAKNLVEYVREITESLSPASMLPSKLSTKIYDDSKITTNYVHFSAQRAAGAGMSAKGQQQILDAIKTMLGNSVKVEFKNLPHAGEFEQVGVDDVIRISVHALNPTTVAYHESLHAFFAKLMRSGNGDIADVLMRATQRPAVAARLRELLAGEPAALRQLRNPEERAAYMFQFWASGDAKLGAALRGEPKNLLQRIAATLRKVLGIWSNEERALHIMQAFTDGVYAQNLGTPNAFHRAMMEPGRNKAIEAARSLAKPLAELGDVVVSAGSARLRESRIPSLVELADAIKMPLTEETGDPGFVPAARLERTRVLNKLGAKLSGLGKDGAAEVLEMLQTGTPGATLEVRTAAHEVKIALRAQYDYLRAAGVGVKDLGPDYFPRVYDATYISKHQDEFRALLDKYGVPDDTMHKIIANGGTELGVEVDRPGMQAKKRRKLDMIPDAELAPFMQKDLYQILNNYVTQATRRAEWARRFGDDSTRLHRLLAQARQEGATAAQIDAAEKYVKGVNGTLGDDINPTARRLMGDMIVYQNIRLLPLAIFSSVVDPMGVLVRGGEVKDAWTTFKRGIREIPKGLRGDTSQDQMTQLADMLGVIDNAALVQDLGAQYSQGMVGDTARKINDGFFRFNLMEQFNRSMRVGATEAALKFMQKHSTGNASAHSARWMRELGLMRGDVQVVNGRVALTQADGLTAAQEARIRTAVNRWVDGAVLRPDAADKPIWMNDPAWALVAHLKQFVYAFHHTILKRVGHEMRNGNYAPAMALASYVPIMIASDMAKGMLQNGGDEPEWKKNWGLEDYVAHGVQRAGLLGIGQLGVDAYTDMQRGGTGVGALAGPTLEQMGDALQVMGGHKQFGPFALRAMPANALYSGYLDEERADLSTD